MSLTIRRGTRLVPVAALTALSLTATLVAPFAHASDRPPAAPELFAEGVVSTDQEEYRISFTPDGRTAYFARSSQFFPYSRESSIYETHLRHGEWSEPVIASFSGTYPDIDPFVSSDGGRIYFSSIRPRAGQAGLDADIYMVERQPDGEWGPVTHVAGEPGTASDGFPVDDLFPSVDRDGTLYYASYRDEGLGGFDLYAEEPGQPSRNLGPQVNSSAWEFNPAIAPNGRALVFTQITDEPVAGSLKVSWRGADGWSAPTPLVGTVNTAQDEYHPSFSPNGRTLYFVRREPAYEANGDLWQVATKNVLPRRRPGA